MAVQGFIQQQAQDAQQISPNNGNPNTVYNTAANGTVVNGGWAARPITPAANITPTEMKREDFSTDGGWVAPAQTEQQTKLTTPVMQLPDGWKEAIQNWAPNTEANTGTTAPATPAYDLNKQWIVMDGNVPRKNANLYANDPAYKAAFDQIDAEYGARENGRSIEQKSSGPEAMAGVLRQYYQMYYDNGWRPDESYIASKGKTGSVTGTNSTLPSDYYASTDPKGWARLVATGGGNRATSSGSSGITGGATSGAVGVGLSGGKTIKDVDIGSLTQSIAKNEPRQSQWNSDTSRSVADNLNSFVDTTLSNIGNSATADNVMKMLDAITEPFLPGNFYMSELGRVNMANVLTSVLNQAVPGIGTLGKWLAGKIPQGAGGLLGKIRDFFQNGKFQDAANEIYKTVDVDAARNQAVYGNGGGGGGGNSSGWASGSRGGGWLGGSGSYSAGTVSVGSGGGRTGSVTVGGMTPAPKDPAKNRLEN